MPVILDLVTSAWPNLLELAHKAFNVHVAPFLRAEVPGLSTTHFALKQLLPEVEVSRKRLQDVLPGPHSLRVANYYLLLAKRGLDEVGHEPVLGPVAAADHVASPGTGHQNTMRCSRIILEEAVAIAGRDQFDTGLGAAVRIV